MRLSVYYVLLKAGSLSLHYQCLYLWNDPAAASLEDVTTTDLCVQTHAQTYDPSSNLPLSEDLCVCTCVFGSKQLTECKSSVKEQSVICVNVCLFMHDANPRAFSLSMPPHVFTCGGEFVTRSVK